MPKKRADKALLIKPGSSRPPPTPSWAHDSAASVNDLIRESRRLQIKDTPTSTPTIAPSAPPQIRHALNLPTPEPPLPRPGSRVGNGPSRTRRIPGPPPPRSWLKDSTHAPLQDHVVNVRSSRLHTRTCNLPGGVFPPAGSLQDLALKDLAKRWNWHVQYYGDELADIPIKLREALLSYLAMYGEVNSNHPLRLLFMSKLDIESREEVRRLDFGEALGSWTSLKRLEKDLGPPSAHLIETSCADVSETWEDAFIPLVTLVPSGSMFKELKHVSLALKPGTAASWKDLIRLAERVPTITSLSLAHWPTPTYTPRAATTRAIIQPQGQPTLQYGGTNTVYGGTNMYSSLDSDWRESAGILRALSRAMYCLEWLDLTGCNEWVKALTWGFVFTTAPVGPAWNGSWRSINHICLGVGWEPVGPERDDAKDSDDAKARRQEWAYQQDMKRHAELSSSAREVAAELRSFRQYAPAGGKWIEFEF